MTMSILNMGIAIIAASLIIIGCSENIAERTMEKAKSERNEAKMGVQSVRMELQKESKKEKSQLVCELKEIVQQWGVRSAQVGTEMKSEFRQIRFKLDAVRKDNDDGLKDTDMFVDSKWENTTDENRGAYDDTKDGLRDTHNDINDIFDGQISPSLIGTPLV